MPTLEHETVKTHEAAGLGYVIHCIFFVLAIPKYPIKRVPLLRFE